MSKEIYNVEFGKGQREFLQHKDRLALHCQVIIEDSKNFKLIALDPEAANLLGVFHLGCESIQNSLRKLNNSDKIDYFIKVIENVLLPVNLGFRSLEAALEKKDEILSNLNISGVSEQEIQANSSLRNALATIDSLKLRLSTEGVFTVREVVAQGEIFAEESYS
ncbi:MAG: hypothetical protein KBB54_00895 [Candidatus Pacebacteria bacterium]|nr:hypothetical protein [Candidatus Paceibacterota bacterium]MBP9818349.1 hypothetical protein [Candidatus Paceibacterota bacterium]